MKKLIAFIGMLLLALPAFAANVAPLGLEIGVASLSQVRAKIGAQTRLQDAGSNAYSRGKMLKGGGDGLGIEGLQEITFIFDAQDKLDAVLMRMSKDRFKEVYAFLKGKYKVKSERIPFVGDSYARLAQGDSVVELEAPHLSFEMDVRYLSNKLMAAFNQQSAQDEATRKKAQSEKF